MFEEVDNARTYGIESPGQTGMDGGDEVNADHHEQRDGQEIDTSKVVEH